MSPVSVRAILEVFDRAADEGCRIDLWWRDDDAVRDGPRLERLLGIARRTGFPVALAVVPDRVEPSLVDRVAAEPHLRVLVHGLAHLNHAPADQKAAEFGAHRPLPVLLRDAARALSQARAAFGTRVVPVFVPPWNRFDPRLAPALAGLGYGALSAFGQARETASRGLVRLDAHLDPVDWRGSRGVASPEVLASALRRALGGGARRIGLVTHHLVHDAALWDFCETFAELAVSHSAVQPSDVASGVGASAARSARTAGSASSVFDTVEMAP